MATIVELIQAIEKDFIEEKFDKFIKDATFPNFKKLAPLTKIEFKFPLTVLVGPNGGGKSSILHALWGMPHGHSTNRFWFSTAVDPILEETNGKPNVPRYWYSHYIKEKKIYVQTRKVKGTKREGYWEPSKPSVRDGMDKLDLDEESAYRSTDRWTPVKRSAIYINTKAETSAFDRFFYYTEIAYQHDKQAHFIKESLRLRNVLDNDLKSKKIGTGEFVFENKYLGQEALKKINRILQKKYLSARYVVHRFYDRNKAPSVIFETEGHTYSESFAGSGELAIVNLVLKLEKLKEFDLLLLDEPETSLHPGAQKVLINVLLEEIKHKKLQVVISTHSPTFVESLPEDALVVLEETDRGVVVNKNATKGSAFYRLGHIDPNKITILTEDILLKVLVERALEKLEKSVQKKCDVQASNVGSSEMLSNQVPAYITAKSNVVMVLDGDQIDFKKIIDVDLDNLSKIEKNKIPDQLKACFVSLVTSDQDLEKFIEKYFAWCKKRILLIDQICPEQIFLQLIDPSHAKLGNAKNQDYKKYLRTALLKSGDETTPAAMAAIFKSKLGERSNDKGFVEDLLKKIADKIKVAINFQSKNEAG